MALPIAYANALYFQPKAGRYKDYSVLVRDCLVGIQMIEVSIRF